ncbi:VOC family protein [Ktedonobacter racemifer]|uniref:Biphenyl-2,3-diol 1,2-dioxygenase n=1 Tax=Ktedonobacter racemifer DSM 44963 TaxID=485913 RepID=D6TM90_KTERA|nr:VOC family protein [Ktedonobacter racemifer]EFH86890.1 Biphenyl-2,3-diol 1,2-dioxygenase [Ktedonobacter racemifer DSM 44963]
MLHPSEQHALICPTFHHFGVITAHLEEMLDWYAKVLGMTAVQASHGLVFLSNDRAHHRLAVLSLPGTRDTVAPYPHAKIQHVAFEYATIDDLLTSWERLKEWGIEPVLAADHGPTTAFYYQDPDGNSIEVFVDNFGDWDASSEYMRTSPDFQRNPMGAFVDPAQMREAHKAGATAAELHRRAKAGEFPPARPMNPQILL